jgi:starch synthase (maltosyl-transferring)
MRPNFFANTPDILHEYLQKGGPPAFRIRFILAATLAASYGLYSGYELFENVPVRQGSEEYLDSEKFELKRRRLGGPLLPLIRRLNEIRRAHPALQRFESLQWLATQNDDLIAFAKRERDDIVVVVVNLDPAAVNEGLCIVPPALGLPAAFAAHDLLNGATYGWRSGRNYVKLPAGGAHIMVIDG